MMLKNLLAALALAWALVAAPSLFSPAEAGYYKEGDSVDVGPVCHELATYEAVAEAYVRSLPEGNAVWDAALNSNECVVIPFGNFKATMGRRMGSWALDNGDVMEVWEVMDADDVVKYTGVKEGTGAHDGNTYMWKGDEVYAGEVCSDLDTLTAIAGIYTRSVTDGNLAWAAALESGDCFKLSPRGEFVLGDLVSTWRAADGDVIAIWTLLTPGGRYPPVYSAFDRGTSGGVHDTPYVPSDDPGILPIGWAA